MIPRTQGERDSIARELGYTDAEACREACERLADREDFAEDYARDAEREYGCAR